MNEKLRAWLKAKGIPASASHDDILAAMQKATASGELTYYESVILCGATPEEARAAVAKLNGATIQVATDINSNRNESRAAAMAGSDMGAKAMAMLAEHGMNRDAPEFNRKGNMPIDSKPIGKHFKTGQPVLFGDAPAKRMSDLEKMKTAVYLRAMALRTPGVGNGLRPLSSDERDILADVMEKDAFVGKVGYEDRVFRPGELKTLISDTNSGGAYVDPVWLDNALVQVQLLFGELLPYVDVRTAPMSSTVETAAVNPPEVSWSASGDAVGASLASTSGLLNQIAATQVPASIYLEVGRDLLSDTPADLGSYLEEAISQRFASEIDNKIAGGNGTTEIQGIANASGIGLITSENGIGGPATVADYELLVFGGGVGKQYRTNDMRPAYVANDVVFGRARGISRGADDASRVFGMDHADYRLFNWPFRVANGLANTVAIFGALSRYRLWRRPGFDFRWETGGKTLALSNSVMLIGRQRMAGKVVDANAFCKCVTMEQ